MKMATLLRLPRPSGLADLVPKKRTLAEAVFVLHCFQKKSKRGIATPKEDMDIIHARLKIAQAFVKELRK
jgi:hypothetical protein